MSITDKLGRPLDKGSVVVASVGPREIAVGIVVIMAKKMARIKVFGADQNHEILRYPSELIVLSSQDQVDALDHIFTTC